MFYIKQKNWDKILGYAEEAYSEHKSEIGGMSVMVEDKDGDWELQDVVILKKEISSGNTILEKEALAEYYTKQAMKMGKKNFRFCWWHSHHTMSAFWSGTDIKAIDEFNEGDFSFALVVNLKGEYKFRVSVWKPVEVHEDTDLEIIDRKARCTKKMKKEVEDLCSTQVRTIDRWKSPSTYGGYGYNYKSPNQQTTIWNSDQTPKQISIGKKTKQYHEIVEEIDGFGDDLTDGTITFKAYTEAVNDLNKELEKEKNIYRAALIREDQKNDLLHILPHQLVIYAHDGSEVEDLYNDWGYGGYGV